jgi:hypothetical protein
MLVECVTQPCSRDPCFFPRLAALMGKSTALYFYLTPGRPASTSLLLGPMGAARELWLKWKMLKLPWRKTFLVGR